MTAGNAPSRPALRADRRVYLAAAALLFLVEVAIAVFVKGGFVRHTLGDVLVVMLLYCALMAATRFEPLPAVLASAGFAFAVEAAQAADVVDRLGLADVPLARVVIGSTFSWGDIVAYALGAIAAFAADIIVRRLRATGRPTA